MGDVFSVCKVAMETPMAQAHLSHPPVISGGSGYFWALNCIEPRGLCSLCVEGCLAGANGCLEPRHGSRISSYMFIYMVHFLAGNLSLKWKYFLLISLRSYSEISPYGPHIFLGLSCWKQCRDCAASASDWLHQPPGMYPNLWLVGGLEHGFSFSIYWECHNPNWLSYFSEG